MRAVATWWPVGGVPAVLWVGAQILYPLTDGAARDRVTVAVVLLSAGTALVHAALTRGVRWALGLLVIVSGAGLVAEVVGTATGFPFGCYDYASGRIGPEIAGVPLIVALAWTGGVYPIWIVCGTLYSRVSVRVSMTALGAVGWDLYLDPQMVADGQWTWCSRWPGLPGLPGIPVTNYLGWLGVAVVMGGLLAVWERTGRTPSAVAAPGVGVTGAAEQRVSVGRDLVPVAVFLWTWLGSALAHAVFLGLPVSAGYGLVGMGVVGIPLVWALSARRITLGTSGHGTM
ncbi:carotenoid biosynthesis protein [Nocardia sp. NPDC050406]|uniref:carotenoid biosynthesis protein n=1 Tax=Nocardia sp. NPDC050406 TaxID=3364318 RepID=UPI0037A78C7F